MDTNKGLAVRVTKIEPVTFIRVSGPDSYVHEIQVVPFLAKNNTHPVRYANDVNNIEVWFYKG